MHLDIRTSAKLQEWINRVYLDCQNCLFRRLFECGVADVAQATNYTGQHTSLIAISTVTGLYFDTVAQEGMVSFWHRISTLFLHT